MKKILFGIFIGLFSISASFAAGSDWTYIKGTVFDENNQPLIGATVVRDVIDGTGAFTGADGKFSLRVMPSDNIIIEFLGYETQKISLADVQDLQNIKIIMKENAKQINSVQVVAIPGVLWEICVGSDEGITCEATSCVEPRYKLKGKTCIEQKCENKKYTSKWSEDGTVNGGRYLVGEFTSLQPDGKLASTTLPEAKKEEIERTKHKCVLNCPDGFHQVNDNCISDNYLSQIEEDAARLDELASGLKINKWRNKEGHFNTMRLMSDMTAGIVLGTTGALITSKMVKKSQIEDGFEDLQCTISGQSVAQFGDDFTVYIR